jgi:hypothetical protein
MASLAPERTRPMPGHGGQVTEHTRRAGLFREV